MNAATKDLQHFLETLRRHKWLIALIVLPGLALTLLYTFSLPPVYRSTTVILVEQQKVPEAYVRPTVSTTIKDLLKTISQQIMSRTNLEKIVNQYDLYSNQPCVLDRVLGLVGIDHQHNETLKEDMVRNMREDIEVKVSGKDAFTVSYSGYDPTTVMWVTNTLASYFIEENLRVREEYAEGTSFFLASELERARDELESQEKALRGFKEAHMGSLPEQLDANLRTLDRLQIDLQDVNLALRDAESQRFLLNENRGGSPNSQNALETELLELRGELKTLRTRYTESYPDVKIVKDRIRDIESILSSRRSDEETAEVAARQSQSDPEVHILNSRIALLEKRHRKIRGEIESFEKRVEEIPGTEQKLAGLLRDYEICQLNYQSLLDKKLNARLSENLEKLQKGDRFRVIDSANLAETPYKPNRQKIFLIGAVISLFIGIAVIYLIDILRPVIYREEDLLDITDIPVLGSIPSWAEGKIE